MSGPLAGRTALVTGAHRGIGAACALALAEAGAEVACADLLDCADTVAAIAAEGGRAVAFAVDVADEESVLGLLAGTLAWSGRLDILLHAAGMLQSKPLPETTAAEFDRIVAVNLRGSFLVGREALRVMTAAGGEARVILVASDMAHYGRETFSGYIASKHDVLGLVRSWAKEFAPGILVNAICPGPIDTAMLDAEHMSPAWREKELQIPLRRFGQPAEIGAVAAFL